MAVQSISATLVTNLKATGNQEAIALAGRFERHEISEKDFIAQAGQFSRDYSFDALGAMTRSGASRLSASGDAQLVGFGREIDRTGVPARDRGADSGRFDKMF